MFTPNVGQATACRICLFTALGPSGSILDQEMTRNKRSISVTAGLVPAIHVGDHQYLELLSLLDRAQPRDCSKSCPTCKRHDVDDRDKPGHDGADRFTYFAASPN